MRSRKLAAIEILSQKQLQSIRVRYFPPCFQELTVAAILIA
jgi:hypothetical protein